MYILDKTKAREILVSELNQNPALVDRMLEKYPEIHDELADSVKKYLEDRTILDHSAFGISLKEIIDVNDTNLLVAVKEMNVLFDEGISDEKRKEWVNILRTPRTFE